MEYFRLTTSKHLVNPIRIEGLDPDYYKINCSKEDYGKLPEGIVSFYQYVDDIEFPGVILRPTLMVNGEVKDVLQIYDGNLTGKSVKVFASDREIHIAPTYWVMQYEEVDCLDESVVHNSNGTVEELIIRGNALSNRDVFKVKGTLENFVIISLAVVESLLRRKIYGVGFEKVKVV